SPSRGVNAARRARESLNRDVVDPVLFRNIRAANLCKIEIRSARGHLWKCCPRPSWHFNNQFVFLYIHGHARPAVPWVPVGLPRRGLLWSPLSTAISTILQIGVGRKTALFS